MRVGKIFLLNKDDVLDKFTCVGKYVYVCWTNVCMCVEKLCVV